MWGLILPSWSLIFANLTIGTEDQSAPDLSGLVLLCRRIGELFSLMVRAMFYSYNVIEYSETRRP